MNRRELFRLCISVSLAATGPFLAIGRAKDKHGKHGWKHGRGGDDDRDDDDHRHGHGDRPRYFREEDHVYLRQYYGGPADLPPGLRKKYYRTGKLPPGWQKRFRPFPVVVVERLPPLPAYCDRGYVDGYAVVYDRRTRVILDVIDLIDAATGR
jgi:hypothetical protein